MHPTTLLGALSKKEGDVGAALHILEGSGVDLYSYFFNFMKPDV